MHTALHTEAEKSKIVEHRVVGTQRPQCFRKLFGRTTVVATARKQTKVACGIANMHVERNVELCRRQCGPYAHVDYAIAPHKPAQSHIQPFQRRLFQILRQTA